MLGAWHLRDVLENKPTSSLVVSLGKALNGAPLPLCGRQVIHLLIKNSLFLTDSFMTLLSSYRNLLLSIIYAFSSLMISPAYVKTAFASAAAALFEIWHLSVIRAKFGKSMQLCNFDCGV